MAALAVWIISGLIARPFQGMAEVLKSISSDEADVARRLPIIGGDDAGMVFRYFNTFVEILQKVVKNQQQEADEKIGYCNDKVAKATHYAEEMASMADSVNVAAVSVDVAVLEIAAPSATDEKLAESSARTTREFRA